MTAVTNVIRFRIYALSTTETKPMGEPVRPLQNRIGSHHVLMRVLRAAILGILAICMPADVTIALELELNPVVSGLTAPIDFDPAPDGSGRFFIAEQRGRVLRLGSDGRLQQEPFLDLRDRMVDLEAGYERRGLLAFAMHPRFADNGRVYVTYTAPLRDRAPGDWNHTRRVSEFTLLPGNDGRIDPRSERVLLELDWPSHTNVGGGFAFGPDGYLYVGLGDGGVGPGDDGVVRPPGDRDPYSTFHPYSVLNALGETRRVHVLAQDVTSLFGSILRLDVDTGFPDYGVPDGNPFIGLRGRDEIFAWGFRDPFGLSFDMGGRGDLVTTVASDVLWESIYLVDQPGNFGWPLKEGAHCVGSRSSARSARDCARSGPNGYPLEDPIVEYPNMRIESLDVSLDARGVGSAVVGAVIYRGKTIPELRGRLVFADWSKSLDRPSGQLFVATPPNRWRSLWPFEKFMELDTRIVGLAQDNEGEIYVLTNDALGPYGDSGRIFKLVPVTE